MKRVKLFFILLLSVSLASANSKNQLSTDSLQRLASHFFRSDVDSSLYYAHKLVDVAIVENDIFSIVRGNYYLGYIYVQYKANPYKGLIFYLEAIKEFELNPTERARKDYANLCMNVGTLYKDYDQLEIAERFYNKSFKTSVELNNLKNQSILLNSLAELQKKNDNLKLVNMLTDSAIQISKEVDDLFYANMANDAGVLLQQTGQLHGAINHFKGILKTLDACDSKSNLEVRKIRSYALENLGTTYMRLGDYEQATDYFRRALPHYTSKPTIHRDYNFFNLNFDIGELFYLRKNYDSANFYFSRAEQYISEFDFEGDKDRFRIYQLYANSLDSLGNQELAYEKRMRYQKYLENYVAMQENSAHENQKLNIDLITKKYFEETGADQIIEARMWWMSLGGGAIIFILLSVIFVMTYQKYRVRKRISNELKNIINGVK